MSPCLSFAFFTVWRYRGLFGSSAFFVNNFRSSWNRESRTAPLLVLTLSSRIYLHAAWPPSSVHDLWGCDLTLTSGMGSTLTLTFTKQKTYNWRGLIRGLLWCLNFASAATFSGVMSQKPNSDLRVIVLTSEVWGHELTWDLIVGYQLLRLVTNDMFIFFAKL